MRKWVNEFRNVFFFRYANIYVSFVIIYSDECWTLKKRDLFQFEIRSIDDSGNKHDALDKINEFSVFILW